MCQHEWTQKFVIDTMYIQGKQICSLWGFRLCLIFIKCHCVTCLSFPFTLLICVADIDLPGCHGFAHYVICITWMIGILLEIIMINFYICFVVSLSKLMFIVETSLCSKLFTNCCSLLFWMVDCPLGLPHCLKYGGKTSAEWSQSKWWLT